VAQAASQDAVGISPARLGAFSHGILAIAVTILILDVRTPASNAPVWSALQAEWPALAAYASIFLIIGIGWIHHHNLFHQERAVDRSLLLSRTGPDHDQTRMRADGGLRSRVHPRRLRSVRRQPRSCG
jgi:uncharacterized membrane protein